MKLNQYESERVYNYLTGFYCILRSNLTEIDQIEWLLDRNRVVLTCKLPILSQIKPQIELQTTIFQLNWHRNKVVNGLVKIVIQAENDYKLTKAFNGEKSLRV